MKTDSSKESGKESSKDSSKEKAVDLAMAQIERQYGKGAIMRWGADSLAGEIPVIPTGALSLDIALGVGGLPKGRVVEIYGPEASEKTTLALHVVAEAQKKGGTASFIDAEHALDVQYARRVGVDIDKLLISQPVTGEQALEITEILVRSAAVDVVVIDSVAALVPKAEIEGDMERCPYGASGQIDVSSAAKVDGDHQQIAYDCYLCQSDPDEDRNHVWKPGDDHQDRRNPSSLPNIKPRFQRRSGKNSSWRFRKLKSALQGVGLPVADF